MTSYTNPIYEYSRPADYAAQPPARHPVVVVGAGPVGLAAAIDLAQQGVAAVVLDEDDTVSAGSRAVCYAKRTLEILDRLGCGEPVVQRGVSWNLGRVFFQGRQVYQFNLQTEAGHHRPPFVNLQQYHFEEILVGRAAELGVDLRWRNRVIGVEPRQDGVRVRIETPEGEYALDSDWLIVCDGAKSPVRHMMGLESKGQVFRDRFLIADVLMKADYPTERWFWFDPPFHRHQSALLHRQADNVWRVDFQLGWDADPEIEKQPERVMARLKHMLGEREFELEWVSVYTFSCRRMEKFRHGRVLFAGDAAHQVSPFGARGANSGIQDADNLAWKLGLVLEGRAPQRLLDSYSDERVAAADENILNSTRSTDFITPKSGVSHTFRDAVLLLAERYPFARRFVNSGRLSLPTVLATSSLNTPDSASFKGNMVPGAPGADAPVAVGGRRGSLLERLGGRFDGLYFARSMPALPDAHVRAVQALAAQPIPVRTAVVVDKGSALAAPAGSVVLEDLEGLVARRYDGLEGSFYLLRPDQHVCARWRNLDSVEVLRALARATCND